MRLERIVNTEGEVVAHEVLSNLFLDREKLFKNIDEDNDFLVFASHMEKLKKVPAGKYFLNIKPTTLVAYYTQIMKLVHELHSIGRIVVLELIEACCERKVIEKIRDLREGMLLSIDDFGFNCSNMDRVLSLKPEFIKLDLRLGIQEVVDIGAFLLTKNLRNIIVERVETEEEFEKLKGKFRLFQGYLFEGRNGHTP